MFFHITTLRKFHIYLVLCNINKIPVQISKRKKFLDIANCMYMKLNMNSY